MSLWYGSILSDEKSGSVWEFDFELVILRMAFFCITAIFWILVLVAQLTIKGQYSR